MTGPRKKPEVPFWARTGHRKPVTRREFLAAGMIPFAARLLAPSLWTLVLRDNAFAQTAADCPASVPGMIPFITINLSGGPAMAANFVPMGQDGAPLPSYNVMGLGDGAVPIEKEFGNATFAGAVNGRLISQFLQGMRNAGGAALTKTAFVGSCVQSRDDTTENRFGVEGMLVKAGVAGSLLPILGTDKTPTGIQQRSAVVVPPAPLIVENFSSLTGAIGYAGTLRTALTNSQKSQLSQLIKNLSAQQSRKLASMSTGPELKKLIDCAGIRNTQLVDAGTSGVDPRKDTNAAGALNQIWQINDNTGSGDRKLVFASMVYNVLKQQASAASINLGGYDYHDDSRGTGDARDLEAGTLVGQILASAEALSTPVFIYVTSDGAVSSAESNDRAAPWRSDRGEAGASYMLMYDPQGRRIVKSNQLGWFTRGQVADASFITGANPELASAAVIANYLQVCGKLQMFDAVAPKTFETKDMDTVIKFI